MDCKMEEDASARSMIGNGDLIIETNKRNQYFTGIAVCMSGLCAGTVLAWTSSALEFILESNTTTNHTTSYAVPGFTISTSEEATVGAILMLGGLLSAFPSAKSADLFGRKPTLIIIGLLYWVNFVVIACANDVLMVVVARFLAGLALGGCCVVSPMYIGEIAEQSLRGILGSLFSVFLGLGILYTNIIGIFANWIWLSIGLAFPSLAFIIIMAFCPESPMYLVAEERFGKAKRALTFLRGNERVVEEELTLLKKKSRENQSTGTIIDLFTQKRYRRPLIAGLGVFVYQQFCGINLMVFYLVPIFKEAGSAMNPMLAATTTNFITLLASLVPVFIIERRNRKYFLMLSAIFMFIGTFGLGLFFHLKDHEISFAGLQTLPIICLILYMVTFAIGLGPVPWILMIELYTPEIRGIANGVIIVSNWFSAFFVTFSYPYLMQAVGSAWTFYLYSLFNVAGCLFIWFVVPETRPKTII